MPNATNHFQRARIACAYGRSTNVPILVHLSWAAVSAAATPGDLGGTLLLLVIGAAGILVFYVMLVFAPRQVADREGTAATWAIRFLLFLISLALGQTITGLLHPG